VQFEMMIVENGFAGLPKLRTLRTMFEDRKSVFVDLLKWDLPVLADRFEVDQFDDEDATYIIIADRSGDHLASARLLKTTKPHILGTMFRQLCAAEPPQAPNILEITRFCLSRRQNAASRAMARRELVSGLVAYALASGIQTYTGVAEFAWFQQILAFGWDCRPLGVPIKLDCGTVGALAIEITPETPRLLAANAMWEQPNPAFQIAEAA
jgi:N-acyl-L-homoserine lactone synthetase